MAARAFTSRSTWASPGAASASRCASTLTTRWPSGRARAGSWPPSTATSRAIFLPARACMWTWSSSTAAWNWPRSPGWPMPSSIWSPAATPSGPTSCWRSSASWTSAPAWWSTRPRSSSGRRRCARSSMRSLRHSWPRRRLRGKAAPQRRKKRRRKRRKKRCKKRHEKRRGRAGERPIPLLMAVVFRRLSCAAGGWAATRDRPGAGAEGAWPGGGAGGLPGGSLAVLDGQERQVLWPGVVGAGADDLVVDALLDDVARPAAGARDHEQGRDHGRRHAHHVVTDGAEPVEVGEHLPGLPHHRLQPLGNVEHPGRAGPLRQRPGHAFDDRAARVADGVDRVAEAGHHFLGRHAAADVG